jgi:hypothetical protein
MLDVLELEGKGAERPELAESLPGTVQFFADLCRVQAARAAGEVGRICAELVFGYQRHPNPEDCDADIQAGGLETFEALRRQLDGRLTEARLAKDRASRSLADVMIPEALGYPS